MSRFLFRCLVAAVTATGTLTAISSPALAHDRPTPAIVDTARGHGNVFSLTFDDGPNPPDTLDLLKVLRKHHVKAVFCLVGDQVRLHPDVVRKIAAEGHTLCNHSLHHDDLSLLTPEQIRADLQTTSRLIHQAVPWAHIAYFRAPYGAWGQSPQIAADLGMQPLGWRFDIEDWVPPGTDVLAQRIRDRITPGAVALMHDGGGDRSQTVAAVDQIIPELRAQGWRFTLPLRRG
ncbi:polysaccharide deacetylase family protein [Paractinoplanes toevensis]|uniref:Oligosaccharide deacetylase n=1 Tax=Paractinoplanes toevensis TaxID=571911 RepID=A0A919W3Y7_9ACTN|nr:polysaccharide deacetylase family protein [Actinoplanes toevensis]GIM95342.1 oligosaccharide deacetylase [Actinoplanes toevensis]